MSVFLSYSKADQKLAEKLRLELEQQGISVWSDASLKPGDHWMEKIEEALRSAKAVLVLVGSHSSHDEWQQSTWRAALEAVWQNRDLPLIPLLIGDAGLPPFVFSDSINTPVIRLQDASDLPNAARTLRSVLRNVVPIDPGKKDIGLPKEGFPSAPPMKTGDYESIPPNGDYGSDPPVTKGDYFAEADRERHDRRREIRQFVESLKN